MTRDAESTRARYAAIRSAAVAANLKRRVAHQEASARSDGRVLSMFVPDDNSAIQVESHGNTRRFVRLAALQAASKITADPAMSLSYYVRNRLAAAVDRQRMPGLCRVIDPETGAVKHLLDPFTRQVVQP